MDRRKFLIGCAATVSTTTAGCLSDLGLSEHKSVPGSVDGETVFSTGYEETRVEPIENSMEFTVDGDTKEVTVVMHHTEYKKAFSDALPKAVFSVFTAPTVSILGTDVNPLSKMGTNELVNAILGGSDAVTGISQDEETPVTLLGEEATSTRYTATAGGEEQNADIYVRITEGVTTENEDILLTFAVYPQSVAREDENAIELTENTLATHD